MASGGRGRPLSRAPHKPSSPPHHHHHDHPHHLANNNDNTKVASSQRHPSLSPAACARLRRNQTPSTIVRRAPSSSTTMNGAALDNGAVVDGACVRSLAGAWQAPRARASDDSKHQRRPITLWLTFCRHELHRPSPAHHPQHNRHDGPPDVQPGRVVHVRRRHHAPGPHRLWRARGP